MMDPSQNGAATGIAHRWRGPRAIEMAWHTLAEPLVRAQAVEIVSRTARSCPEDWLDAAALCLGDARLTQSFLLER